MGSGNSGASVFLAGKDSVAKPEQIRALIEEGRQQAAATVNATMTLLYWRIGKRINQEVLHEQRAEYGKQIVSTLAKRLETDYGRGFSEKSLRHMMRFA